jgi:hypothetical protein
MRSIWSGVKCSKHSSRGGRVSWLWRNTSVIPSGTWHASALGELGRGQERGRSAERLTLPSPGGLGVRLGEGLGWLLSKGYEVCGFGAACGAIFGSSGVDPRDSAPN